MPPSVNRLLLTSLHSLLIVAMLSVSLAPLAVVAAPMSADSTRPVSQELPTWDEAPEPVIPIPTPETPFDPNLIQEAIPWIGPNTDGAGPTIPIATPEQADVPGREPAIAPVVTIGEADNVVDDEMPIINFPLDQLYGEETPEERDPFAGTGVEMSRPLAPVALKVELDRYVLAQGEQATLSIRVGREDDQFSDDAVVTLTLPPQLRIVGDVETTKVWTYDAESLAARIHQTFTVQVDPSFVGVLPAVADIELEVSVENYAVRRSQWRVGITGLDLPSDGSLQRQTIQTSNGTVLDAPGLTLLVPASAAPADVQLGYTPLYTATTLSNDEAASAEISSTVALTDEQQLLLPTIRQDNSAAAGNISAVDASVGDNEDKSASVPTLEDNGVALYQMWHLSVDGLPNDEAANGDDSLGSEVEAAHPRFDSPVLMVVDVAYLVDAGVDMGLVGLWTRPDAEHPWTLVHNAKYDAERRVWVAWLHHFSDFATGIVPSASNERLPSVDGFSSDRHTGAANINIPIDTPAGLGGLSPNLSLNYSTMSVEDIFAELGHDDGSKRIQANMAGYGWNLGGVNYIAKYRDADDNVYYTLILNGASYDIYENPYQPGTYDTNPMSFAAITNTFNLSTSVWKIKTTDGMYYEFGGDLPDLNWTSGITRSLYVEMRTNKIDDVNELEVVAWYLSHVEDTAGNSMDYHYEVERANILTIDTGGGGCLPDEYAGEDIEESDYAGDWYNPVTRLISVTWGSNVGKYGDAQDARLRARFEYLDDRTDFDHPNGSGTEDDFIIFDGCQPRKTRQRLEEIEVQAREYESADWQLLRRYNLDFDPALPGTNDEEGMDELLRHQLLTMIHEYGAEGALFNTHSFSYTKHLDEEGDTENSIWLTEAENGFGGKTTYDYEISEAEALCDHGENCEESGDFTRHLVGNIRVEDGQNPTNYYVTDYEYGGTPIQILFGGRVRYFGVNHATATIYQPTTNLSDAIHYTSTLTQARFEEYWFYQFGSGGVTDPDPRHGRLKEEKVFNNSAQTKTYFHATYEWTSHIRDSATTFDEASETFANTQWIRLDRQNEWTGGAYSGGSGMQKRFYYDPAAQGNQQFGNITAVEEHTHSEFNLNLATWQSRAINNTPPLNFYRRTETTYFPNTAGLADLDLPYIVDRPARVIVKSGGGVCYSENRTVYIDYGATVQNRDGAYNLPPATTLVAKNAQVVSGCPLADTATGREDSAFLVKSYAYDDYGNQTSAVSHNGDNDIIIQTAYDDFYHLFPIERWNNADDDLKAKASYYGVNGVAVDSTRGFWGAMSETCEINDICTRFGYDEFGRKTFQWDRQLEGSSWPVASAADGFWRYQKPGAINPAQNSYIVTEWHSPRCEGNWVRRHYDGLGRLVVEQKSYQDYKYDDEDDNCLPDGSPATVTGHETVTYFAYDAFGVRHQSAPRLEQSNGAGGYLYYAPTPNLTATTLTYHDPLGRVTAVRAPNKDYIRTTYDGRRTIVFSHRLPDINDYKVVRWHEFNPLGYLQNVRSITRHNNDWFMYGLVELSHDVVGNMTRVKYSHFPTQPSTYTYDQAGRMTAMNDMDMGSWSYTYNRHSQLTQQKDARNISTCLYYDAFARLEAKHYTAAGGNCPATSALYHEKFTYGTSGSEAGQLTDIQIQRVTDYLDVYTKTLEYNGTAQVIAETIIHRGYNPTNIGYTYDPHGRVEEITYPDTEVITYTYNGMGLHNAITSSVEGTIADAIGYDELGRISSMRLTADITNTLYLTQTFYKWDFDSPNGNRRLENISVGTPGSSNGDLLLLGYRYDNHGNIQEIDERYNNGYQATHTFEYDILNHLREANYTAPITVTHPYTFHQSGRLNTFGGKTYAYASDPVLAPSQVTRISDGQQLAFTYDANGNMTQRQYFDDNGVKQTQTFSWHWSNKLGRIDLSGSLSPTFYSYDADGLRTVMQQGTVGNLIGHIYPSPYWEIEWMQSTDTLTATRYYMLNGQPIALKIGEQPVTYLHRDHLGSVVMSTQGGAISDSRMYYAYGSKRGGDEYPFDANYTGQRLDDTGLLYYNARFYDPQLGIFISPDSMIPDPTDYYSYNRYMYGRGNPISNNDPSGNTPWDVIDVIFWGISLYEFSQNPTWANAGWALLDTASLLPVLPSAGYVRRGTQAALIASEVTQFVTKFGDEALQFVHIAHKPGALTLMRKFIEAGNNLDMLKGARAELNYALTHSDEIVELGRVLEIIQGGKKEIDFVLEGNVFVNIKDYDWSKYNDFVLKMEKDKIVRQAKDFLKYDPSEVRYLFTTEPPQIIRDALVAEGIVVDVIK